MSIAAKVPIPRRMLDGVPSDTRVVIASVTWEFYNRFSRAVHEGRTAASPLMGKTLGDSSLPKRLLRQSEAGSCPSDPRTSRGGYSPNTRAI
jgi:hypothetical protein